MAFTASDVKALREKTGVGMMDCKKALVESDGDMDKAIDFLREKGLAAATKKASRIAAEGVVMACTDEAKQTSVIIEVNSRPISLQRTISSRALFSALLRLL